MAYSCRAAAITPIGECSLQSCRVTTVMTVPQEKAQIVMIEYLCIYPDLSTAVSICLYIIPYKDTVFNVFIAMTRGTTYRHARRKHSPTYEPHPRMNRPTYPPTYTPTHELSTNPPTDPPTYNALPKYCCAWYDYIGTHQNSYN